MIGDFGHRIVAVYCDGGMIPSADAGTYAYCYVDAGGARIYEQAGYTFPSVEQSRYKVQYIDTGRVTSPISELVALCSAMEDLPITAQPVTVYCDCENALQWVFGNNRMKAVTLDLQFRVLEVKKRLSVFPPIEDIRYVVLDGHPSKNQIETGIGKRGNPVSIHNVWCDDNCNIMRREYEEFGGFPNYGICKGHGDGTGAYYCCTKAGECNGFTSGELRFTCPWHCPCHD